MSPYILEQLKKNNFFSLLRKIIYYPFNLRYRLQYRKMLKQESLKDRFNQIYQKNLWRSEETPCGEGSELNYTVPLRKWLIYNLSKLKIKHLVDAPCGDFNWMKKVVLKSSFYYSGFDIVNSLINKNKSYSNAKIKFAVANICKDQLPNCDLLIVRDCLFHFSYDDINKFLKNINKIKYKYLLTTTHIVGKNFTNHDIVTGDFRIIDLFSYPFNFNNQNIIDRVKDYPKGHSLPREMILIKKKDVPKSINYKT
jgi:hypothetical protein